MKYAICSYMDGLGDYHIEWSKSEKQILYINACMWKLEKWYRWAGLQGRSWDTDVENRHMDTKGGKLRWGGDGGVLNWAIGIDVYTQMCIKLMTNKNLQYKQTNKQTKDICTCIFTAALFTIAKSWKQPKCSLIHEWIKKLWYTYTHTEILFSHKN